MSDQLWSMLRENWLFIGAVLTLVIAFLLLRTSATPFRSSGEFDAAIAADELDPLFQGLWRLNVIVTVAQ